MYSQHVSGQHQICQLLKDRADIQRDLGRSGKKWVNMRMNKSKCQVFTGEKSAHASAQGRARQLYKNYHWNSGLLWSVLSSTPEDRY